MEGVHAGDAQWRRCGSTLGKGGKGCGQLRVVRASARLYRTGESK